MPNLIPGDAFVADIRHAGVMPTYGDVAVFHVTRDPRTDYVKRVVGLPGDLVQLRRGVLYLNGQPVRREAAGDWKYAAGPGAAPADVFKRYRETLPNGRTYDIVLVSDDAPGENTAEFKVPPDRFFALGDNRDNSLDSRHLQDFGYALKANVVGIASTVFWSHDMSRLFSRVE
jgi:signal peptidase I